MPIHVVVCEHQPDLARMISCRLMRADLEVHSTHDSESATEVLRRVRPHLLITHLQPAGIALVRSLRDLVEFAELPVIGLSPAFTPLACLVKLREDLQLAAVLQKPFSLRQLVALAGHVAKRSRPEHPKSRASNRSAPGISS
jgi:DNA-binding response OmpR family regulator